MGGVDGMPQGLFLERRSSAAFLFMPCCVDVGEERPVGWQIHLDRARAADTERVRFRPVQAQVCVVHFPPVSCGRVFEVFCGMVDLGEPIADGDGLGGVDAVR